MLDTSRMSHEELINYVEYLRLNIAAYNDYVAYLLKLINKQ